MSLEFALLADRTDAVPIVARWYFEEWGNLRPDNSIQRTSDRLEQYMNRDTMPFIVVATRADEIVGAAQLKFHEMAEEFPDKEHWLGGVYVAAGHRGHGYGSVIVERVTDMAPKYGVQTLYLQTEALDGGLYARLGWTEFARVNKAGLNVLVMERQL